VVEGGELGEVPGVEAELWQWISEAGVERGGATTAAQRCGAAEEGGVRVSGSGLRERGRSGAREAGVAFKGGGRGSRREGLGEITARITAGDSGGRCVR